MSESEGDVALLSGGSVVNGFSPADVDDVGVPHVTPPSTADNSVQG